MHKVERLCPKIADSNVGLQDRDLWHLQMGQQCHVAVKSKHEPLWANLLSEPPSYRPCTSTKLGTAPTRAYAGLR